jgi:hypothetical protein
MSSQVVIVADPTVTCPDQPMRRQAMADRIRVASEVVQPGLIRASKEMVRWRNSCVKTHDQELALQRLVRHVAD